MKDDVNAKVTDLPPDEDLVLDPNHPMRTARRLVEEKFTVAKSRTMHRHRGTFWRWDGACYREASQDAVADAIWKFLEHAKRQNEKGDLVDLKPDRGKVGNVRELLASVCFIGDDDDPPFWLSGRKDMPPAGEFFACANGLLHVPTGRLYPSTPDFFGVSASGVAYDESAEEPVQWLAFLKQVLEEEDAIMLLQDWMGYTLTPDTSLQKILLCIGPPRSGKGTVYRIQADLLGSNSVAGPTMSSLGRELRTSRHDHQDARRHLRRPHRSENRQDGRGRETAVYIRRGRDLGPAQIPRRLVRTSTDPVADPDQRTPGTDRGIGGLGEPIHHTDLFTQLPRSRGPHADGQATDRTAGNTELGDSRLSAAPGSRPLRSAQECHRADHTN